MKKIGISGVPGSGKTSLARALASSCRLDGYKNVELVSEYAREYISKHGLVESVWEQCRITDKQLEWEESVNKKADIMISDSPIYMGFLYAIELVDFSRSKDVMCYNDLFKKLTKLSNRYDFVVHLNPDIRPVEDDVRQKLHFDENWRQESNSKLLNIFNMFGQKNVFVIINSDMDERIKTCLNAIRNMSKK